jgi:hypothetical protein
MPTPTATPSKCPPTRTCRVPVQPQGRPACARRRQARHVQRHRAEAVCLAPGVRVRRARRRLNRRQRRCDSSSAAWPWPAASCPSTSRCWARSTAARRPAATAHPRSVLSLDQTLECRLWTNSRACLPHMCARVSRLQATSVSIRCCRVEEKVLPLSAVVLILGADEKQRPHAERFCFSRLVLAAKPHAKAAGGVRLLIQLARGIAAAGPSAAD